MSSYVACEGFVKGTGLKVYQLLYNGDHVGFFASKDDVLKFIENQRNLSSMIESVGDNNVSWDEIEIGE